jgi:hypothetical protein
MDDHKGREISVPHAGLYRAMRRFLDDLTIAEAEHRHELNAMREKMGVAAEFIETPEIERLSWAVQIFAAMTIEALISFYAVLRFGGEHHDAHFRWESPDKRLRKALRHAGVELDEDTEILMVVRDIMEARHAIAHPFSAEYKGSEQAAIQLPRRRGPDGSTSAARMAVAGVDRFLRLLSEHDSSHGHFFAIT